MEPHPFSLLENRQSPVHRQDARPLRTAYHCDVFSLFGLGGSPRGQCVVHLILSSFYATLYPFPCLLPLCCHVIILVSVNTPPSFPQLLVTHTVIIPHIHAGYCGLALDSWREDAHMASVISHCQCSICTKAALFIDN